MAQQLVVLMQLGGMTPGEMIMTMSVAKEKIKKDARESA
jgi:hypothetical protein